VAQAPPHEPQQHPGKRHDRDSAQYAPNNRAKYVVLFLDGVESGDWDVESEEESGPSSRIAPIKAATAVVWLYPENVA
jgi:hypothetical protein